METGKGKIFNMHLCFLNSFSYHYYWLLTTGNFLKRPLHCSYFRFLYISIVSIRRREVTPLFHFSPVGVTPTSTIPPKLFALYLIVVRVASAR